MKLLKQDMQNDSNPTLTRLKVIRREIKKHTLNNIFSSYDTFKKDVRGFKDSIAKLSNGQKSILDTMKKNIKLIRIKYDEPLTKTHIKKKLKSIGILNV